MKLCYLMFVSLLVCVVNAFAADGDVTKGKTLAQPCAACHGVDGNSTAPIWPKIAGQHAAYIVKQLKDFKSGNRVNEQMAAMVAALSDEEMLHLGAYYASQKVKIGVTEAKSFELGQRIYRAGDATEGIPACMACHGPNGAGNPAALYPALTGQHAAYIEKQLKLYRSEELNNDAAGIMRTVTGGMTNEQIKAVSQYIQGLH